MKLVALLSIFSFVIPTHCSEQPWYNSIINEWTIYKKTTLAIDLAMGIRTMILKPIMATNPDRFIKILKTRLEQMEKNIRVAEANAIADIVKENGLGDEYVAGLQKRLIELHKSRREYISKPQPDVIHDKDLSPKLVAIIKKQLVKANININSLHLIKSSTPSIYGHDASASSPSPFYVSIDNDVVSVSNQNTNPGNISFFPSFYLYPEKYHLATGIHEAGHIIEGHSVTIGNIPHYINFYTHTDQNDIEKSKNFQKLLQIHERQAEVLPSLKNKKAASLIRDVRSYYYYPKMLYGKHYMELSNIDEIHKMIAHLESIKKIRANHSTKHNATA